jgi:metal-dependent amidase/aminoacylase/carboxypeptidase family protein
MAILGAVGRQLAERRPAKGRVVLLFQPAEENGQGAAGVLGDPRFIEIRPDHVFALHNLPGYALGEVVVKEGTFCCASKGVVIKLEGSTGHAAQPETGNSPAAAMCRIMDSLAKLGDMTGTGDEIGFATVVGAGLGADDSFGTTPGAARIMATLRAETDETLERLTSEARQVVEETARMNHLKWKITFRDEFPATVNAPDAVAAVRRAAAGGSVNSLVSPFAWSEDFGHFTALFNGALFGLGAGVDAPDLHHPTYDFPDGLIEPGAALFMNVLGEYLG